VVGMTACKEMVTVGVYGLAADTRTDVSRQAGETEDALEGQGVGGGIEAAGFVLAAAMVEGEGQRWIDHGAEVEENMGRSQWIAGKTRCFHAFPIDVTLETGELEVVGHGGEGVHRKFVAVGNKDGRDKVSINLEDA
jgi:hypothetical protein